MLGETRFKQWPESRWAALGDMVDFMEQQETAGLSYDMNEDMCYNCHCNGDLVCCDGCTAAYHLSCANLFQAPENEWFCGRCREEKKKRS